MPQLTKRAVESAKPSSDRDIFIWDGALLGFGLRIKPSGVRSYVYQYRNARGVSRRLTLGKHGRITLDQARSVAGDHAAAIARGEDPAETRKSDREAQSMRELSDEYLLLHAPKKRPSSIVNDRTMLNNRILPRLGSKKVADVSRADIERLHLSLKETPYLANRTLALLGKMFSLAVNAKVRPDNPCRGIVRFPEQRRERWLSDAEIKRLVETLNGYRDQRVAGAIKLMLLTGSRRGEVLGARWDDFDLDRGVWTKSSHHTKQKRTEHVPLSASAIQLLVSLKADAAIAAEKRETTGPNGVGQQGGESGEEDDRPKYLFPGRVEGHPLTEIKKAWRNILEAAALDGLRLHDLRHTFASHLVSSGTSLHIVGRLLGHTQPSTTARYAHLSDDALRHAADRFSSKLSALANSAPLPRRTRARATTNN
jgi:integrase